MVVTVTGTVALKPFASVTVTAQVPTATGVTTNDPLVVPAASVRIPAHCDAATTEKEPL